jgi:hypothetical protein
MWMLSAMRLHSFVKKNSRLPYVIGRSQIRPNFASSFGGARIAPISLRRFVDSGDWRPSRSGSIGGASECEARQRDRDKVCDEDEYQHNHCSP